jgi:hypothetical protein
VHEIKESLKNNYAQNTDLLELRELIETLSKRILSDSQNYFQKAMQEMIKAQ